MKLECSVEKLLRGILYAERITGKNLSLPILGSILLIASGKSIKLRSTNLSLGIEIEIPAIVEKEGVVAIKGDVLSRFLATITDTKNITLTLENDSLVCTSKNNFSRIKTASYEDFPTIPIVEGVQHHISCKKFIEGIKSVYYSSSTSDIKPEIASIYIYTDADVLSFVATDSFRLAEKKIKISHDSEFPGILIPYKNIIEIIRIFEEINDDITITASKNQLAIAYDGIYLTSRIIDAIFPDYKQIIPKEITTSVVVLKEDFMRALKIANIFSDKFNQITFTIDPAQKAFFLATKNNDVGENKTMVDGTLEGEPITISFNYKYIIDCFQSINADSIILNFNGINKPLILKGGSDATFRYLIMPMNR
jgi:DNA polymerase-3 subunit beta